MDEIAEKGYAAHYKYKMGHTRRRIDVWLNLLKEALENSNSAVDFVEDFKMNLYSKKFMFLHQKETSNPYQRSYWILPLAYIQK
jgi:GTP pyrophosphokinase